MFIVNYLKIIVIKPFYKLLNVAYVSINTLHANARAIENKDRSLRALERLDAHLLEDVGLCRVDGKILSLKDVRAANKSKVIEGEHSLARPALKAVLSKRRLSSINRRNANVLEKDRKLIQKPLE